MKQLQVTLPSSGVKIPLVILAVLLGILVSLGVYRLWLDVDYSNKINLAKQTGSLTPEVVREINWKSLSIADISKVNLYTDDRTSPGYLALEFLLKSPSLEGQTNNQIIVFDPQLITTRLASTYSGFQIQTIGSVTVSSNYIYVGREFVEKLNDPTQLTVDLILGLIHTKWYLDPLSELPKVDLAAGNNYCLEATLVGKLVCVSNKMLTGQELPEDIEKYLLDNVGISSLSVKQALNIYNLELEAQIINNLQLSQSQFTFKDWNLPLLQDGRAELDVIKTYHNISAAQLDTIQANTTLKFNPQKSDQAQVKEYGLSTTAHYYASENPLVVSELTILSSDTANLNADCLRGGIGQVYCDNQSLFKNSGLYVQLVFGHYNRYK